MAVFKRIVSYVYSYDGEVKRNNIGFARLEQRGSVWKMMVSLRCGLETSASIYIFCRKSGEIFAAPIGEISFQGGNGIFKSETSAPEIFGTTLTIDDLNGMLVAAEETLLFGTSWDDDEIHPANISYITLDELNQKMQEEADTAWQTETSEETSGKNTAFVKQIPGEADWNSSDNEQPEMEAENIAWEEHQEGNADNTLLREQDAQEIEETRQQDEDADIARETARANKAASAAAESAVTKQSEMEAEEIPSSMPDNIAEQLLSLFPQMFPFEGDRVLDSVRMELQDLSYFPMESWVLTGNTFLLHGFYCYRHLLFCKRRMADGTLAYALGIPGIHHVRDEAFAGMFGFTEFQSLKDTSDTLGEYGYWFMPLFNGDGAMLSLRP